MMTAAAGQECPLCVEPLDATERHIQFCSCGFSICRFCWKRLMESDSKRCPHCREEYDETKVVTLPLVKTDDLSDEVTNKKKKKKSDRKKGIKLTGQERRNLQELRILQKNLVYAVGLSLDICIESVLAQNEFFGQFGSIKKISVNRSSPYSSGQSRNGPTGAAYVTFVNDEHAANCVSAIDGAVWDGHYIRACFGTTKYCQAFLKGAQCNNPDCLYMHYLVNEGTFTKEEMNSGFAKGKPEFYNLINFDRSKGPVPGSLAKPPKGPGSLNKKDSQSRGSMGLDLDAGKRRSVPQEQDWPHLTQRQRDSLDGTSAKTDRLSHEMDKATLMTRKSAEGSWTSTALKSTASGSAVLPSPFQSPCTGPGQKKTLAVLSSPVKVKMVTTRSSRGGIPTSGDPPFGHPIGEEHLIPRHSTESNLSHVSFNSDGRQSPDTHGLNPLTHASAESLLRATKSATPLEDDPSRDYTSMANMIRRRISVPERMVDDAVTRLLPTASGRRGPPPGFNKLQTHASAHEAVERAAASDRLLQSRLSYEVAADAIKRQAMTGSLLDQLAQNMMTAQPNVDLSANLLGNQNPAGELGIQPQHFVGNLESPFGGTGGQTNIGQSNLGYPLSSLHSGYNTETTQNDLLQSLISASSGLSLYPLQGKSSQLSGRGSMPTMQTRLSADAIDRTGVFDMETLQKNQMVSEGQQAHPMTAYLNTLQDSRGLSGQPTSKLNGEGIATQQNMTFPPPQPQLNAASQVTPSPFNDPAILAFKKPGQQEVYQMGGPSGNRAPDPLMPLREQNNLPATPFDDPIGGTTGIWASGMSMPLTPFLAAPPQQPEMHPAAASWMGSSATSAPTTGTSLGLYGQSVGDQVMDAAGFFHPDKVSSTQT